MSDPSAFLYCPSAIWWLSDLKYSNSDVRIPPSLPVCYPFRNSADIPNSTPPFWRSCPHCPTVIERLLKIQFLLAQQPSLSSHNMDPPINPWTSPSEPKYTCCGQTPHLVDDSSCYVCTIARSDLGWDSLLFTQITHASWSQQSSLQLVSLRTSRHKQILPSLTMLQPLCWSVILI